MQVLFVEEIAGLGKTRGLGRQNRGTGEAVTGKKGGRPRDATEIQDKGPQESTTARELKGASMTVSGARIGSQSKKDPKSSGTTKENSGGRVTRNER